MGANFVKAFGKGNCADWNEIENEINEFLLNHEDLELIKLYNVKDFDDPFPKAFCLFEKKR